LREPFPGSFFGLPRPDVDDDEAAFGGSGERELSPMLRSISLLIGKGRGPPRVRISSSERIPSSSSSSSGLASVSPGGLLSDMVDVGVNSDGNVFFLTFDVALFRVGLGVAEESSSSSPNGERLGNSLALFDMFPLAKEEAGVCNTGHRLGLKSRGNGAGCLAVGAGHPSVSSAPETFSLEVTRVGFGRGFGTGLELPCRQGGSGTVLSVFLEFIL